MRKISAVLFVASCLLVTVVEARQYDKLDYARVLDAVPVYADVTRSEPERECWTEQVRYEYPLPQSRAATPSILGAMVGAAVGHNVARSRHGQGVGRVAGAVLGASIGNDIARSRARNSVEVEYRDEQRCEYRQRTYTEHVVVGYDVTYEYHGNTYRTRMDRHPGKRIQVAVDVRPVY